MTNGEKSNLLNELLEYEEKNDIGNLTRAERREFQQWISKALDQEPKISLDTYKQVTRERDIAIEQLHELGYEFGEKIRTGHWYRQTNDYVDYYECSNCGMATGIYDVKNYCPNCGARMIESQEREDK